MKFAEFSFTHIHTMYMCQLILPILEKSTFKLRNHEKSTVKISTGITVPSGMTTKKG